MLQKFFNYSFIYLLSFFIPNYALASKNAINIETWHTKNQVPVYFTQTSWVPMLNIAVTFNAGSARDNKAYGLGYLTNFLITKNITNHYETQLETASIITHSTVTQDLATIYIQSMVEPKTLNRLTQVLADYFSKSNFQPDEVAKAKLILINKITNLQQSAKFIGTSALYKIIYGAHPYGHNPLGKVNSIKAITSQHIQNFYNQYYVTNNALITLSGDISRTQAEQIAEKISAALKPEFAAPSLAKAHNSAKSSVSYIPIQAATQSHIFFGQVAISPRNVDYFPFLVANHLLGYGSTISYLGKEIRVKQGLSYRIASNSIPLAANGMLMISFQTRIAKITQAVTAVKTVLAEFTAKGPSDIEVIKAKNFLKGNLPLTFSSNNDIIEQLIYLGFYKLPLDYFETYNQKLEKVTTEQVKNAFQRHIDPDKFAIVIVGQKG